MCGIIGCIGNLNATDIVFQGLKRLEYRGYDSWGMAFHTESGTDTIKRIGKVEFDQELPKSHVCVGHCRWSTHGAVTIENTHPHFSEDKKIAVVHNGIIENYLQIRKDLETIGYKFRSETDTESVVYLVQHMLKQGMNFKQAVIDSLKQLKGSFALVFLCDKTIIAARRDSPLLIGVADDAYFAASDFSAFTEHTKDVIFLQNNEMAVLSDRLEFYNYQTGDSLEKNIEKLETDNICSEKGKYKHFMLKEIMEQPEALQNTLKDKISGFEITNNILYGVDINKINRIVIIACGTSWHAGLVGEFFIEKLSWIPVEVEYASEFRYRDPVLDENTLCIAISQSGETADTIAAIKEAKSKGSNVVGIINVKNSTMTRECVSCVYTEAGPEIGVASTKAFTTQLAILFIISLRLGLERGKISKERVRELIEELKRIPFKMDQVLELNEQIRGFSEKYYTKDNALFLGRGTNYPIALEGALKLKEISYIHAEGYPAAEMKHGPIALIDENMPVVFLALKDSSYEKILGNIQEVKSRKGKIIVIATEKDVIVDKMSDNVVFIPETDELLVPFLSVIPLQLLAYHIADRRGCDIDKPRNLAKSVTVE